MGLRAKIKIQHLMFSKIKNYIFLTFKIKLNGTLLFAFITIYCSK